MRHRRTTAASTARTGDTAGAVSTGRVALAALLVGTAALAACGRAESKPETRDGLWESTDYAGILDIEGDQLQIYETTAVSCLKVETSTGFAAPDRFLMKEGDGVTVRVIDADRAALHLEGAPGDRPLRRLSGLPETCKAAPPSAFDVFWQTFQDNYPFFAAKGIDWNQVRDRCRERALSAERAGDDAGLFAVLKEMITPLDDAHVMLTDGKTEMVAEARPGTTLPSKALDEQVRTFLRERDLGGQPWAEFANGRVAFATLPNRPEIGYLRVSGFSAYTAARTFEANSAELARALDTVFDGPRLAGLRGLVLDVRLNGGGSDSLALQLAGRFTDRSYLAYTKKTRTADPRPIQVEPAHAPYTGPIAILTGGSTMSAGETFTQAMMGRPGRTLRIGQPTQGVFSDVLGRKLPGASRAEWSFGLPNEIFLTADGRAFDGPGIPPDITEPVFTEDEFAQRRDSAFDRAVAELGR
ncbi:protease [Nocardia panacis]|uniref:Protease n=1 Tax=Nocardia panacis TaxID=2340916 RepID=A0A3A4KIH5_9NOCA|nr:S41 family peptidase [Nocardia panacis]RJO79439.1 protease [Nocardia panacis]